MSSHPGGLGAIPYKTGMRPAASLRARRMMEVFGSSDFDGHEEVSFLTDAQSGLQAIIALHSTNRGPALGGCRMVDYASEEEGLRDVLRLSRAMTYKAATANVPFGGGKCVIFGEPARDKNASLLRAVGRAVGNLSGRFYIGEDVGTTTADMAEIRKETATVLGLPVEMGGSGDPSPWTARGCLAGIRAALTHRGGPPSFSALVVAVQGLGHVGWELCRLLHRLGVTLVVSDIRSELVNRAVEAFGAQAVSPDEIYDVVGDIFAPCALGGVLNDHTIHRLRVAIVAGSANNQLEHARHDRALLDRGILYAPDYVINAGGMIRFAGEILGWDLERVGEHVDRIHDTLVEVFELSERRGMPTGAAADGLAESRFR